MGLVGVLLVVTASNHDTAGSHIQPNRLTALLCLRVTHGYGRLLVWQSFVGVYAVREAPHSLQLVLIQWGKFTGAAPRPQNQHRDEEAQNSQNHSASSNV